MLVSGEGRETEASLNDKLEQKRKRKSQEKGDRSPVRCLYQRGSRGGREFSTDTTAEDMKHKEGKGVGVTSYSRL